MDTDIHPVMLPAEMQRRLSARWARHLERYGRRAPHVTDLYPRPRNKGMRADSWPEGGVPGSDYELLREQLLDEHGVDFGSCCASTARTRATTRRASRRTSTARSTTGWWRSGWTATTACGPRSASRTTIRSSRWPRSSGAPSDPRFVQVLFPAGGQEPFGSRKYWPIYEAAAAHGLPVAFHTGGYSGHRGTGWPSFYLEEHAAYGVVDAGRCSPAWSARARSRPSRT